MKKTLAMILAVVMLMTACVAGTLAWLQDKTDPVVNTFTVGTIDIELDESDDLDLQMIPGSTITKDPVVTVKANSEACWLFVKIEKSDNFGSFMTYAVADGWTALAGVDGVYYRAVEDKDTDQEFAVIKDNTVTVNNNVTKGMMDAITNGDATAPTLTFTAYAVQSENVADATTAWGYVA